MNRAGMRLTLLIACIVAVGAFFAASILVDASPTPSAEFVGLGVLSTPPTEAQVATINQSPRIATVGARVGDKQERIRFIGVDVGDTNNWECKGWQTFDRIFDLIPMDAEVYIETGPEVRDGDGNIYAHVWYETPTGYRLINETLLAEGLGSYVEPDVEHAQYVDALRTAADHAKENGIGIWETCGGDIHVQNSPCEVVEENLFLETNEFNVTIDHWWRGGHAVRSPSLAGWYLVGADIEGPGAEGNDQIGVWVADSIDVSMLAFSFTMPGPAVQFQAFYPPHPFEDFFPPPHPWGSGNPAGYDELIECVRGALN